MKFLYYSMYPEDFDCDEKVRRLDLEGVGFFVICLNYAWTNDGLPADFRDSCATLIKQDRRVCKRLWPQIAPNFPTAADGRLRNPRQERERKKAVSRHDASLKANEIRWKTDPDGYPNGVRHGIRKESEAEQSRKDIEKYSTGEEGRKEEEYTTARANGALPPPPPPAAAASEPGPETEPPPPGLTPFEQIIWQASRDMILPAKRIENEYGRQEPNPVWEAFAKSMRYAEQRIRRANDPVTYARHVIQQELRALGFTAPRKAATVGP